MTVEKLIDEIRALSPDEIRSRLTWLENEQKTLRLLLRSHLTVQSTAKESAASGVGASR